MAFDIAPEAENIQQQDWLKVEPFPEQSILVVGNPPFGNRSKLAKAFIKQSQKIGAETIAFILPDTFSKLSNQSFTLFPKEWKLIVEYKLEGQKSFLSQIKTYIKCLALFLFGLKENPKLICEK